MELRMTWVVLVLVLPAALVAQAPGDSLQTALDAITRRQRDLSLPARPSGYYALSQYRHKPPAADDDDIAFLEPARDFAGDGQPENIGYGYQKTVSTGPSAYSPQLVEVSPHPSPNVLEKVLIDYVKDAYANAGDEDANYYQQGLDADTKRSLFRERGNDVDEQGLEYHSILPTHYDGADKQENIVLPTMFRERFHSRGNTDHTVDAEKLRHYATQAIAKQLEAEEDEERMENKRNNDLEESDQEEEYLNLLQNLWEKYKESKPQVLNIEDLTQNDVQEILSSLRNDLPLERNPEKRQYRYGSGFDIFNNAGLMGGWGGGSGNYAKRNKQRIDDASKQRGNFLYSLKFVSPEGNREAVETLTDDEGIELPDERDEDILHLASGFVRNDPEDWMNIYGRPVLTDEIYNQNEEPYQRLLLENPDTGPRGISKKKFASLIRDDNGYHQISPSELMMIPGRNENKRFIYETKRKRYPVTKRSSNFYASPPMLHHKSFITEDVKDSSKKKNIPVSGVTDPKVAQELNQIFSSSVSHEELSKATGQKPNSETQSKVTSSKEGKELKHETTTFATVTTVSAADKSQSTKAETKTNLVNNNTSEKIEDSDHGSHVHGTPMNVEKETVEPITMSKIQTPLEIKKKSIDWSDYFGIDRRRKKTAPQNIETKSGDSNVVDDNWLLNQYYKTLAMVSNPLKKQMSLHTHEHIDDDSKKELSEPVVYNTDVFARSSQREATKKSLNTKEDTSIDSMDSKLRNMEDLIVNEAVKYTGSHEGTQDPKEVQDMKDKIMSRLAAAYSLEKMRLALAEFKSSLQAQMMSRYNPENQRSSLADENVQDESKMKRVAVKKEKAEDTKHKESNGEKKKRGGNKEDVEPEVSGEFLDGPVDIEPMSEGYMGRSMETYETGCPILDHILQRCRSVGHISEDRNQVFLPLCSLHQICNFCGPEVGSPSPSACDLMFLTEADSICDEDMKCQRTSRRIMTLLRRGLVMSISGASADHCSNDSCLAQYFLTSPLPNNQPR